MSRIGLDITLATTLFATVVGASATPSATATLTNLHYELIDLDPGDGVAPSLTFVNIGGSSSSTDAQSWDYLTGVFTDDRHYTTGVPSALHSAVGVGSPEYATADLGGPLSTSPITQSSTAATDTVAAQVGSYAGFSPSYLLSAHTELVFEGSFARTTAYAMDTPDPSGLTLREDASATVRAGINAPDPSDSSSAGFIDLGSPPSADPTPSPFQLTYSNHAANAVTVALWTETYTLANEALIDTNPPPPVPEPPGAALLLAGLAGLAFTHLRQRQRVPDHAAWLSRAGSEEAPSFEERI